MADLSITAASVVRGSGSSQQTGTSGTTVSAGQTIYLDATDGLLKLADCDAATALSDTVGIALHAAISGQPLTYQTGGNITIGATTAVGVTYVLSDTPGGLMPIADLETGDRVVYMGIATTTSNISLSIQNTGVTFA